MSGIERMPLSLNDVGDLKSLLTTEVRWFRRGSVPQAVHHWFSTLGRHPELQPPRLDYYLRILDGDALGIKIREGKVEVKQRHFRRHGTPFGGITIGWIETWHKWSFSLASSGEHLLEAINQHPTQWIGVRKERSALYFRVTAEGRVTDVPATASLLQGCGVELSKIVGEGWESPWWSLGFEAFGLSQGLDQILKVVAEALFSQEGAPQLKLVDSYGYPRWLLTDETDDVELA